MVCGIFQHKAGTILESGNQKERTEISSLKPLFSLFKANR
jgi:hypothetical protein